MRLPEHFTGLDAQLASTFNDIAQTAEGVAEDSKEAFVAVASEGRTKVRLKRSGLSGGWRSYADNATLALDQLTAYARDIAGVVSAVVQGDFSRRLHEEGEEGV